MCVFRKVGIASAAIAVCSTFMVTGATASPVTLFKQNNSDTFDGGGSLHVTVGTPTANAMAGGFRLEDQTGDPILAWCLDIMNNLTIPATGRDYTITATPFSATSGALSATAQANVEGLFETAFSTVDITDNVQSAGYQMALWEVLYETDSTFDLTSGSFKQTKTGADQDAAEVAANDYLALLAGGVVTQSYAFSYYESATGPGGNQLSQNLVSVAAVPLPAAAWMLGLGLAGLYGARRRQKA